MKKQVLPSINVPMSEKTGDVSFPWYMYFKKVADAVFGTFRSVFHNDTLEGDGTEEKPLGVSKKTLDSKVNKSGDTMSGELTVPELTVAVEEGALNVSVIGNTPTIASNNGMDVLAATTFDKATKTNDSTTWDKASSVDLVRKAQVATALTQKQDVATAVNYDNITNCITEIPQDIKLELADGTLTLKAGSIVYVPNGAGVFNKKTSTTDVTTQNLSSYSNGQYLVFDNSDLAGTSLRCNLISACYSGATAPTTGTVWYDTTNNKIVVASGGTWTGNRTLPLGTVTISNGAISSIDQVFNGFGYIGSTIFALPGVNGLMPYGFNQDGTLLNSSRTTSSVTTNTLTRALDSDIVLDNSNRISGLYSNIKYNPETNRNDSSVGRQNVIVVGKLQTDSTGKVTLFETKTAFHAVDYNDFETLSETVATNNDNAVHKTGNETIKDIKYFERGVFRSTGYDYVVAPSSYAENILTESRNKHGKFITSLRSAFSSSGAVDSILYARKYNADGTTANTAYIKVSVDGNDTPVVSLSHSPFFGSNNTSVATTKWVVDEFLKRSGSAYLYIKDTVKDSQTTPTENRYWAPINFQDKNGLTTGSVRNVHYTNGRMGTDIQTARQVNGTYKYAQLGVYIQEDGGVMTEAPTPSSSDNSTKIATTAFVKSVLSSSGNGLATFSKAANGYYKFSNGLIIQWGQSSGTTVPRTITMPIAFTGAKTFKAFIQPLVAGALANFYQPGVDDTTQTTTTFKAYSSGYVSGTGWHWFAIGY